MISPCLNSSPDQSLISILGSHGVGKSTILNSIFERYKCVLPPGTKPNRYSSSGILSFIHYIIERKSQYNSLSKCEGRIATDRYAFIDTSIYVYVSHEFGYLNDAEMDLFARVVNNLEKIWITPSLLIILLCDIDSLLERLHCRNKSSSKHFRPFDEKLLVNLNYYFRMFGEGKFIPPFLSKELIQIIDGVKRVVIDTTSHSIDNTKKIVLNEIKKVWS